MKAEDFKNAPKLFCENISLAYTPEYFVMSASSGTQNAVYALTPEHAKRLSQYLSHHISDFEKEHGEIKADWNPNIVSPLQPGIG